MKLNRFIAPLLAVALGLLGAYIFGLMLARGKYAVILVGGCCGVGGGLLIRQRDWLNGIICGLIALVMGYGAEWFYMPFDADKTLGYFIRNLGDLQGFTHAMIVGGAVVAGWMSLGLRRGKPPVDDGGTPAD